ncbi:hypothetical protein HFV04_021390 [Pseudomonas sp. BIGb0427]|uniref:hypothetical protein n=1 Tax=unclassified Pseudomonas TaxID=196821 RepID=UPI0018A6E0AC|nr:MULTISPECIES: hypothetical protein [unclassified Pseudomonas]QPG62059.1 hypothetical protein HFV04_021390 [Pseudomonas sp. BIGb0427]UVM64413.1 hypothetical protein LOY34_13735 [Pseudomonas sp. B21-009]
MENFAGGHEASEGEKGISGRDRWKKDLRLSTGERLDIRDVHRCRKIYFNCRSGTLRVKVAGGTSMERDIPEGYSGGMWGPGGGAYEFGNVDILLTALSDVDVYVHIEWNVGPTFPFQSD